MQYGQGVFQYSNGIQLTALNTLLRVAHMHGNDYRNSAYISWVFNFANLENYFSEYFDTSKLSHIGDVLSSAFAKFFQ